MTYEQLYEIVKDMRRKQQAYYDCKDPYKKKSLLGAAKAAERRVDAVIMEDDKQKQNPQIFNAPVLHR